jgi:ATP-dependent Lon protease
LVHQIRVIKEELGDNDDDEDDVATLEKKMQSVGMPATVLKHAQRELRYSILEIFVAFFR